MDNAQKKAWSRRLPFCVTLLLLLSSFTYLFRPFWFDEVLTLDNFVMRPPLSRIYFLYEIPNNHIVFSMLEKVWINFLALFLNTPFFLFRGLSVLAGALAVFLLAKRMVRSCGLYGGGLLCAAFAASSACAIFATGVRGYMLGFLFTVLALLFAEKIVARPTLPGFLGFFLICLLSVGTTPTNLAALEAVALFHASFLWKRKRRLPSLLYLFAAPVLALVFFYAPIRGKFLRCLQLGEGWFSAGSAVWNLYASFALILLGSSILYCGSLSPLEKISAPAMDVHCRISAVPAAASGIFCIQGSGIPARFLPAVSHMASCGGVCVLRLPENGKTEPGIKNPAVDPASPLHGTSGKHGFLCKRCPVRKRTARRHHAAVLREERLRTAENRLPDSGEIQVGGTSAGLRQFRLGLPVGSFLRLLHGPAGKHRHYGSSQQTADQGPGFPYRKILPDHKRQK